MHIFHNDFEIFAFSAYDIMRDIFCTDLDNEWTNDLMNGRMNARMKKHEKFHEWMNEANAIQLSQI